MEKVTAFLKTNYIAIIIGVLFYGLYLHAAMEGNRLCDCESTEKYNPHTSGSRGVHVNRFYHK